MAIKKLRQQRKNIIQKEEAKLTEEDLRKLIIQIAKDLGYLKEK